MSQANREIIGTRFSTQNSIFVSSREGLLSNRKPATIFSCAHKHLELSFAVFFSSYSFITLAPLPLILAARAFPKAYQSWHVFFYACTRLFHVFLLFFLFFGFGLFELQRTFALYEYLFLGERDF
jgi:hypothetical protein